MFAAAIEDDLRWLGLDWEQPVRRQSDHMADYLGALARLEGMGLLYRCFRTRSEILQTLAEAPHEAPDAHRPGRIGAREERQRLEAGEAFAWRLDAAVAISGLGASAPLSFVERGRGPANEYGRIVIDPSSLGDVVLARKGLGVSYHLAVVVDDAAQGVTEVVRGRDLFAATPIQRLLQRLLGLPTPAYRHHRLLLRPDGKRFAKRDSQETLAQLRAEGVDPATLRRELGFA